MKSVLNFINQHPFVAGIIIGAVEICVAPFLFLIAMLAGFKPKHKIGLGHQPLINSVYHKKALQLKGYEAETFVHRTYFITDQFDVRGDAYFPGWFMVFSPFFLFVWVVFNYGAVYSYFDGVCFSYCRLLRKLEPSLLKMAGVKVVVMPFGADVHDLIRSQNLLFRSAMIKDYPNFKYERLKIIDNVDRWTKSADFVLSGCDWVYYMYHWDKLMLAHFSIDTELLQPSIAATSGQSLTKNPDDPIVILHAPNHRHIKGTDHFIRAVETLKSEGFNVTLKLVEGVPNQELRELMQSADIIADQLIIGWYGMTALEAMCYAKPVICYIDPKLVTLYKQEELITGESDIPLISANVFDVTDKLRALLQQPEQLAHIGQKSREFVVKHHSLSVIGDVFDEINQKIGIKKKHDKPDSLKSTTEQ